MPSVNSFNVDNTPGTNHGASQYDNSFQNSSYSSLVSTMPPQYAATQSMHKLSVQKQCKKENLEKMYEMVKNHIRQNPQFLLKWQEYFAPEVEAVIDKKFKKHFESAVTPYVVGEWKTQSARWTPKFFFETLIPLVRERNPAITTNHDFMIEARKIVFEFSDDGSAEERFRLDVERLLVECQVVSSLMQETRATFSAAQRRALYKDWLDNMEDPAGIKAIGDLMCRKHLAQQTKFKLHALNDQEYFLIRDYIDFVIDEADKTRESFAICKPTISALAAQEKQVHGKRAHPMDYLIKSQREIRTNLGTLIITHQLIYSTSVGVSLMIFVDLLLALRNILM
jgi:hypothetical protein